MQTLKPPIVVKRVGTSPDSGCQYMVIRFHLQSDWTFPYGVRSSVVHEDLKVEQKFSRWQCDGFLYDTLEPNCHSSSFKCLPGFAASLLWCRAVNLNIIPAITLPLDI